MRCSFRIVRFPSARTISFSPLFIARRDNYEAVSSFDSFKTKTYFIHLKKENKCYHLAVDTIFFMNCGELLKPQLPGREGVRGVTAKEKR